MECKKKWTQQDLNVLLDIVKENCHDFKLEVVKLPRGRTLYYFLGDGEEITVEMWSSQDYAVSTPPLDK